MGGGAMSLSPQKQRRLVELSEIVDETLEGDRRFFNRHPERSHRVRKSARAEVKVGILMGFIPRQLPEGFTHYTLIRQISPGVRIRKFTTGTYGADTDLPEEESRALYELSQDSWIEGLEHRLSIAFPDSKAGAL
jgi:hypothetical protein